MPKIEIDVDQILTSAVHMEVEPGDRLVVMGGVVVGVIGKASVRAVVADQRPPAALPPPDAPPPDAPPPDAPPSDSRVAPSILALKRKALEIIRVQGPINGHRISTVLGAEGKDGRLSQALKSLRTDGVIRATTEKRYPS
jgi:hypothetical protein